MTLLTVRNILEHAERIKTKSHVFYVRAAGFLGDRDARNWPSGFRERKLNI